MNQGPKRIEEQIGVKYPNGAHHVVTLQVGVLDSDETVLKRLVREVGTVFNITGTKYKVVSIDPFVFKRLGGENEEALPQVLPTIGETWKPKDPRRKTSFKIIGLEGDAALTDDGRRIQLSRFNRYERLG